MKEHLVSKVSQVEERRRCDEDDYDGDGEKKWNRE